LSRVDLHDVPETALWTLRNRAIEAMRPGTRFPDPEAVRVHERLRDEDFSRFGKPRPVHAQRAAAFDAEIRDFWRTHPAAPVVALGEGLQTSYWRLGRPRTGWFSVDLPESVAVSTRLLPADAGLTRLAMSALDRAWMDAVPAGPAVITAEGLFMYLPRHEVLQLVADCAARFPGGRIVYDSIPGWFSRLTVQGRVRLSESYVAPPMPTSQRVGDLPRIVESIQGVVRAREVPVPPARPWDPALLALSRLPGLRELKPMITALEFAP
jgi:O-methyltransferase involved in polyketide biosynthesis